MSDDTKRQTDTKKNKMNYGELSVLLPSTASPEEGWVTIG